MIEIRLPELSASMTDATLVVWRKRVGDEVEVGDVLAELETDKSSVELEAESAGTLVELLVAEGTEGILVGTVLARIDDSAEGAAPRQPVVEPEARFRSGGLAPVESRPSSRAVEAASPPPPTPAPPRATPLARRMAAQANLDLGGLTGSGTRGRIVRQDVERVLAADLALSGTGPGPVPLPIPAPAASAPFRDERVGTARRRAAERLAEVKRTAPHFYLDVECEFDRLLDLRRELNGRWEADAKLSLNDLMVRIAALALRRVPAANVEWRDGALRYYERVDVAVAVASERGLVTPVVRAADSKGLVAIGRELRDLIARSAEGRLRPDEYAGGTVTLSNLGMYGVRRLFPVLNPPQACILGIGAVEPRAVVRDGSIAIRHTATVTLAADHRALDGATGAELLAALRDLVADPLALLL